MAFVGVVTNKTVNNWSDENNRRKLVGDNTNKGGSFIFENFLLRYVSLYMSDKKTPREASQLFHNIIKASVSLKATGAA